MERPRTSTIGLYLSGGRGTAQRPVGGPRGSTEPEPEPRTQREPRRAHDQPLPHRNCGRASRSVPRPAKHHLGLVALAAPLPASPAGKRADVKPPHYCASDVTRDRAMAASSRASRSYSSIPSLQAPNNNTSSHTRKKTRSTPSSTHSLPAQSSILFFTYHQPCLAELLQLEVVSSLPASATTSTPLVETQRSPRRKSSVCIHC
jgi:hypothetical protein